MYNKLIFLVPLGLLQLNSTVVNYQGHIDLNSFDSNYVGKRNLSTSQKGVEYMFYAMIVPVYIVEPC